MVDTAETHVPTLVSYTEAEAILGIPRKVVGIIVAEVGIVPKSMPSNALAKGLDPDDLEVLRRAWKRVRVSSRSR